MIKNIKQFCGLSDEEKRLIKEKKDDLNLDFSIKCYGYADVYEACCENDLESVLDVLEIHLPFIKEQKQTILEMYKENHYEIEDSILNDFVDYIDDVVGQIIVDIEEVTPKFFERAEELTDGNEDFNSLIDNLYDDFVDNLSSEDSIYEKIENMKMFLQKN